LIEVVDIVRSQIHLQRVEQIAHRHTERLALRSINIQVEPRGIGARAIEKIFQSARAISSGNNLLTDALQLAQADIAAILNDKPESGRGPQPFNRRRSEYSNRRFEQFTATALLQISRNRIGRKCRA